MMMIAEMEGLVPAVTAATIDRDDILDSHTDSIGGGGDSNEGTIDSEEIYIFLIRILNNISFEPCRRMVIDSGCGRGGDNDRL